MYCSLGVNVGLACCIYFYSFSTTLNNVTMNGKNSATLYGRIKFWTSLTGSPEVTSIKVKFLPDRYSILLAVLIYEYRKCRPVLPLMPVSAA